jgi:hypothetical protein
MKKLLFFVMCLCVACSDDEFLESSVFVPDANDSEMPVYSEKGYNTFGAKYERKYFLYSDDEVPCKITYHDGYINFMLKGYYVTQRANYYGASYLMTLSISFPFKEIKTFRELIQLDNYNVNLLSEGCQVTLSNDDTNYTAVTVLSGSLWFKRAQLLRIDEQEDRVILSGVFELRFLNNLRPEVITDGRFDAGIKQEFYYY